MKKLNALWVVCILHVPPPLMCLGSWWDGGLIPLNHKEYKNNNFVYDNFVTL